MLWLPFWHAKKGTDVITRSTCIHGALRNTELVATHVSCNLRPILHILIVLDYVVSTVRRIFTTEYPGRAHSRERLCKFIGRGHRVSPTGLPILVSSVTIDFLSLLRRSR